MFERMILAATFNTEVYEEVEADRSATVQAMLVVVMVAMASGIGTLGAAGAIGFVIGVLNGVVSWAIWAYITFVIGTTLFRTPETSADWGELARTTGFAQSPGILRVLGFVPLIGAYIFYATYLWQLATMVIAVRQALDYRSTWRALGVVVVGFIVLAVLQFLLLKVIQGL
jgi:hypothetical protein